MAINDARGMGMDGRRISSSEEDYVQEGDSSEDFGEHYRGAAIIPAPEPPLRLLSQAATLGIIGEALYPPLQIVEIPSEINGVLGEGLDLRFFMFPTAFNESFKSRWKSEDLSHGRINPIHNYGGTERQISMSFTLPALTVQEAESNIAICEHLAKTVYGRYRMTNTNSDGERGRNTHTIFAGHKEFTIDFGGLIRDERAFINKFTFQMDMDAGVFDYDFRNGASDVTTGGNNPSTAPRAISIDIGFTIVHDSILGFGGPNRVGEPLRWAENRKRDWPHGTGETDVQEYMDTTTAKRTPPRVVTRRHGIPNNSNPTGDQLRAQRQANIDAAPEDERRRSVVVNGEVAAIVHPGLELPLDDSVDEGQ